MTQKLPDYSVNDFKILTGIRDVNEALLIQCLELAKADVIGSLQKEIPPLEDWTQIEKTRFFSALYCFAGAKYLPRVKIIQLFSADEEQGDIQTKINRLIQIGAEELGKLSFYNQSHRKSVYVVEP